jgi:hypothetical protein
VKSCLVNNTVESRFPGSEGFVNGMSEQVASKNLWWCLGVVPRPTAQVNGTSAPLQAFSLIGVILLFFSIAFHLAFNSTNSPSKAQHGKQPIHHGAVPHFGCWCK